MLLRVFILIFLYSISALLAHDMKKKKSIKAHEHGVGILNIVQENNTLVFEFEAPGADIVGFEYEAKSDEDKNKIENALNILANYKNIILPSSAGDCEKVTSNAKVINEGTHSEFISIYKLNCKNIKNLKSIYIKYFDNFELSNKLNIKIVSKNKKTAYVISKGKKIIKVKNYF